MTQSISLDGVWRFLPDPCDEGEILGYAAVEYDCSRWREVTVPTVFDRCCPGLAGYEGPGWFRRTIAIPRDWEGKLITFHCGAANYHATLWVNGIQQRRHRDGFLPTADLVAALHPGTENTLVLRVDNTRRQGEVPGMERGWRPYGGILRSLRLTAQECILAPRLTATIDQEGRGKLRLEAAVEQSEARRTDSLQLEVRVSDDRGDILASLTTPEFPLPGLFVGEKALELSVPGIIPWSPDSPVLYRVELRLCAANSTESKTRHSETFRTGFRTVTVREGQLLLNGEPVLLYGFNRHEDSPRTDLAADPEQARQDLLQIKQLGANFVRLCHYPHDTATLDLCDELGLLVMEEIPLFRWSGDAEGKEVCLATREVARQQLFRLAHRDSHHPCTVLWSVSCETEEQRPEVAGGNADLIRFIRELDPSRLAVHVSSHWTDSPHFEADDVLCLNAYPTWEAHQQGGPPEQTPVQGAVWWTEELTRLQQRYPDRPILITGFGYPAIADIHEGSISEKAQTAALSEELNGILRCPSVCGVAVWCWADHPWPEEPFINRLHTSPFGVVTRGRRRKAGLEVLEKAFQGKSHRPSLVMRRPDLNNLPAVESLLAPGFTLRTFRPDDAEDLTRLTELMTRAFPELTWDREKVADALIRDESVKTVFILEENGTMAATASARWQPERYPDEGYVHWVGGDPAYRGRKLGLVATLATLWEFQKWGAKGAVLHTDDFRLPAIKVYLNLDFTPVYDHATHCSRWAKIEKQLRAAASATGKRNC